MILSKKDERNGNAVREFIIAKADDGKKLEKWLAREMPSAGVGMRRKLFRGKCFRLNGVHAKPDARLSAGDVLQIYAADALFEKPQREDPFLSKIQPRLDLLYEDAHILIADKRPGLMTHPDAHEKVNTLLTHVQAYLYQKGEYAPDGFSPALCNRIDRFTGGIVLIAKTETALHTLNQKIRDREIGKYYYCICLGSFREKSGLLESYIIKSPEMKKVTVSPRMTAGGQKAATKYRVLAQKNGLSLVECELLTGRTHQIRAQMAHFGHPLLGDDQYGDPRRNEKYGRHFQALYAYKIKFAFSSNAGVLEYLRGLEFAVPEVRFIREYFPEYGK